MHFKNENYLPNLLNRPGTLAAHKLHPKRSFSYLLYSERKKKPFKEFFSNIVFELSLQRCSPVERVETT